MTPEDLADAAECYCRGVRPDRTPSAVEVHRYASGWSFDGWRVVARRHSPDFEAHYEDMFQAVEILRVRAE